MAVFIDLNSDLGEHPNTSLDMQIMPSISSCNIACGGHAGDEDSVKETVGLALKHNVAIGAHPSYPDRENFGREAMDIDLNTLKKSLEEQIELVQEHCEKLSASLHHIKPHGALYNVAANDEKVSRMICELMLELGRKMKLYGLAHSVTQEIAKEMNVPFIGEAFADRKYEMDKTLRSRKLADAVLNKKEDVLQQVENLVFNKSVLSEKWISIDAKTICLHSDTEGSVHLAKAIRHHLEQKGVHIRSV